MCEVCGWNVVCLLQFGCWADVFTTLVVLVVLFAVVVVLLKCLRVFFPILELCVKCFDNSIKGCVTLILCCCRDTRDGQNRGIDMEEERGGRLESDRWWEQIKSGNGEGRGNVRRDSDVASCDELVRSPRVSYFNVQCKRASFSFAGTVVKGIPSF